MSKRPLPVATVSMVLLVALAAARAGGESPAADPWASGYALEGWDRIAALQRYPILDEKPPDWQAVSRDKNPLVRLAAALAIGRTPDAALIPHLRPLLMDEYPLVRCWALRALLEIRSPLIREPLLEAVGGWESLRPDDERVFRFDHVGLPGILVNQSAADRGKWVKESAPGWNMIIPAEPMHEWGAWYNVVACPKESEIDAGDSIVLRFTVGLASREESHSFELAGAFASWRLIGADGRTGSQDLYDLRLQFPHDMGEPKRDKIELKAGPNGPFDLTVLTSRRPPPPDVYLFETLHRATMLIRVRRSAEFEKTIPELLKDPLDVASAKTLGQQRVRAAVGPLMEAFAAGGGSGPMGFAAAGALGEIGDPTAAPLLLDHPHLRDYDVFGDTSGALKQFGEAAWPEYEKRILSWRSRLSGDEAYSLAMALRLLGPNGSEAAERARQEIITELAADVGSGRERGFEDPRFHILSAAISAIGPTQPDRVVEVISVLAARPQLAAPLLCEVDNKRCPPPAKERIVRGLRALLKTKAGDNPLRDALTPILVRMASQVFAAEPGPIFSEEEALAAIEVAMHSSAVHKTSLRLRQETCDLVEAWLKTASAPPRDMMRFRLALEPLYFAAGRYEACLAILDVPQEELKEDWQKVVVAVHRGMALKNLRRFDEAQASLQWAVDHTDPTKTYGWFSGDDIRRRYWEVWWMPRRDDLRIRRVEMRGMETSESHLRSLGLRVFGIDSGFLLKTTDPLSGEVRVWATLPQEERGFIPLDEHRVFVALMDKTAALYEEGNAKPVWTRPFSLAPETYLSVGPAAITAAEEDGTLHAIDPATGKTLWTRKVKTSPWTETWVNYDTPIQQAAGDVLVPDQKAPTQLEWVEAATGKGLWTVKPDARLAAIAISKDLVVLGSGFGRVTALNRADGKPAWQADLVEKPPIGCLQAALAFDAAGGRLYAATDGHVWALDAATGRTLWQWTWQARKAMNPPVRPYQPTPSLYPVEDGLFAIFNWSEETRESPSPRHADVVRFTADGKVVLHETSPSQGASLSQSGILGAFVAGNRLALRKENGSWEVWEFLPAAP